MAAVPILENNIHQTMDWVYAIEEACQWDENNQRRAFTALKAVLHELRNLLSIEQTAQLSTQLPLVIRGIFFENWNPNSITFQKMNKQDFLESVAKALYPYRDMDIEATTKGVLHVLGEKMPEGEFEKILQNIPGEIKELYRK